MAPAASPPRRKPRENQYFDLGVRGRKTGLTLPDTGIRDEHGLEPMDHLFSSPEKPKSTRPTRKGTGKNVNTTISSEDDMDVGDSTVPEPTAVLTERQRASLRMPLPRSKSPMKTNLQSPAKRGSIGPSSPVRGSIVRPPRSSSPPEPVRRKLDFSNDDNDESTDIGSPATRRRALSHLTNGTRLQRFSDNEEESELIDEFNTALNGGDDEEVNGLVEEELVVRDEPEPEPQPPKKGLNKRGKAKEPEPEIAPVAIKGKRGRPKRKLEAEPETEPEPEPVVEEDEPQPEEQPEEEVRPAKRAKHAPTSEEPTKAKAAKSTAVKPATVANPRNAGRKPRLASIAENQVESPEIQRRPPMPKSNRGLFILRRETPNQGIGFKQTRSGRNSIKPLAYWAGERAEFDQEEIEDGHQRLLLHKIKEVVRADEIAQPQRSKSKPSKSSKSKSKKTTRTGIESEDEDAMEPWELEPGQIVGDVRAWDPEDQTGVDAPDVEEELAYSGAAIITRPIVGATFTFAKTLTLPFFGSGMVDLEPGAVKKPKNSRRMQMVFFVHYGRVKVMVNNNIFRIGKGGQWMVPRGNFYSIENDYDKPARIFFSQGCEVAETPPGEEPAEASASQENNE